MELCNKIVEAIGTFCRYYFTSNHSKEKYKFYGYKRE